MATISPDCFSDSSLCHQGFSSHHLVEEHQPFSNLRRRVFRRKWIFHSIQPCCRFTTRRRGEKNHLQLNCTGKLCIFYYSGWHCSGSGRRGVFNPTKGTTEETFIGCCFGLATAIRPRARHGKRVLSGVSIIYLLFEKGGYSEKTERSRNATGDTNCDERGHNYPVSFTLTGGGEVKCK